MSCAVTLAPAGIFTQGHRGSAHHASAEDVVRFIAEPNKLLHSEHHEDYCGIVFTDSMEAPTLIKIFDPIHRGVSCGCRCNPPLPGWVMILVPPQPIERRRPVSASHQRWRQSLWT
jgi:hypothetical protein